MSIRLMRKGSAQVHMFKGASFVEDRGQYSPALRSARTNCYHFEDSSVGARPLVLIGTLAEISDFLANESRYGIVNNIQGLPHIYVKVARCRATERFSDLSAARALAAGASDSVKTLAGIVADPVVAQATGIAGRLGAGATLVDAFKGAADTAMAVDGARGAFRAIFGMGGTPASADARFYVEFTPIKGDWTEWLGCHRVNFGANNVVQAVAMSMRKCR
ncbi:hypothetical protein [Bordetella genomosp. 9]|nr:hypothetical protein [Bordetella genomosp. 9]